MKEIFRKLYILYNSLILRIWKILTNEKSTVIHLYSICWNEEKMLPFFLDYYSEFVQKITIYDNYSTDRSEQIMKQYKSVKILKYNSDDRINDLLYLKIKNNCWKKSRRKADFVIVCDIDEFLYTNDLDNLIKYLREQKYSIIKPEGFQMVSAHFPNYTKGVKITEQVKTGISENKWLSKSILFNPNKVIEINYLPGAHECHPIGSIRTFNSNLIQLLHYKDLSLEYILQRKEQYSKRLSKVNVEMNLGTYYLDEKKKTEETFNERLQLAKQIL